jgi:hypothetical protein
MELGKKWRNTLFLLYPDCRKNAKDEVEIVTRDREVFVVVNPNFNVF